MNKKKKMNVGIFEIIHLFRLSIKGRSPSLPQLPAFGQNLPLFLSLNLM
jgi:hypothetical protein